MNRLGGVMAVLVVIVAAVGGYWYFHPHQVSQFVRDLVPAGTGPRIQSPMKNFRAPEY